jgi:hypothetical protein
MPSHLARYCTREPGERGARSPELYALSLSSVPPAWPLGELKARPRVGLLSIHNHSISSIHFRGTGRPSALKFVLLSRPWDDPMTSRWM